MLQNEQNGYDKPQFDSRVKRVMALENAVTLLTRTAAILAISLVFGLIFSSFAHAEAIHDLFIVPYVKLTRSGAAVLQPQTGGGYNSVNNGGITEQRNTVVEAGKQSNFNGVSTYQAPKYDAFSDESLDQYIPLPASNISTAQEVDFNIRNNLAGSADSSAGTTETTFTFTGLVNSKSTSGGDFEYRWDFENDGEIDGYFSIFNSISHIFKEPGEYTVRMEVLSPNGEVSAVTHKVYIAENDAPKAYFTVDKNTAPQNSIIRFDTSLSSDNQYERGNLTYRFDWNGDGTYDTPAQAKTSWAHQFREPGGFNVIMEAADPEGLTARAQIDINILDDNAPSAMLSIERLADLRYSFDGSGSSDDFTPKNRLRFRWDFNYEGSNDINFDTSWSFSPKFTGNYRLGGAKNVRLQVMDEQGFVDETFAQIDVPWPEQYFELAASAIN